MLFVSYTILSWSNISMNRIYVDWEFFTKYVLFSFFNPLLPPRCHYCWFIFQSFRNKYCFIATEMPQCSTIVDFCRMIFQEEVRTIVMLDNDTSGITVSFWLFFNEANLGNKYLVINFLDCIFDITQEYRKVVLYLNTVNFVDKKILMQT